jgi:ribonucleoside-diphosphate reductase alpha chain/ribonucleoside-triphosphate reductase
MEVRKKDGRLVPFDKSRIYNAIVKAMSETVKGIDYLLANTIAEAMDYYFSNKINVSTDMIHDAVENALMDSPRKDVAKSYIIYRNTRKKEQGDEPKYKLLSKEFLSKYKHMESPMSELGNFVYYRTYSRYLPDKKRREYWWETVARSVDYNCSLQESTTREEAEELFDNMFL